MNKHKYLDLLNNQKYKKNFREPLHDKEVSHLPHMKENSLNTIHPC